MNEKDRYKFRLLETVQSLWEDTTGSGAGNMNAEQHTEILQFLKDRLANWKPSIHWAEKYDNSVKSLVEEALRFYQHSIDRNTNASYRNNI